MTNIRGRAVALALTCSGLAASPVASAAAADSVHCKEGAAHACISKKELSALERGMRPRRARAVVGGWPHDSYKTRSACGCPSPTYLTYAYEKTWADGDVLVTFKKGTQEGARYRLVQTYVQPSSG